MLSGSADQPIGKTVALTKVIRNKIMPNKIIRQQMRLPGIKIKILVKEIWLCGINTKVRRLYAHPNQWPNLCRRYEYFCKCEGKPYIYAEEPQKGINERLGIVLKIWLVFSQTYLKFIILSTLRVTFQRLVSNFLRTNLETS